MIWSWSSHHWEKKGVGITIPARGRDKERENRIRKERDGVGERNRDNREERMGA